MRVNTEKDLREVQQKGKKGIDKKEGLFSSIFDSELDKKSTDRIRKLSDEVDLLSRDLLYYRNSDVLKRYKQKIKEFAHELLAQYKVKTIESSVERDGEKKIHQIVEAINQKLEEITDQALSNLKSDVELIGKIDEIRGLMVDAIA